MPRYIEGYEGGSPAATIWPRLYSAGGGVVHKDYIKDIYGYADNFQLPLYGDYVYLMQNHDSIWFPVQKYLGETDSIYMKTRIQSNTWAGTIVQGFFIESNASAFELRPSAEGAMAFYWPSTITNPTRESYVRLNRFQWHILELYYKLSTNSTSNDGEFEIRIDGIVARKETNSNTNSKTTPQLFNILRLGYGTSSVYTLFDDLAFDTTACFDTKSDGRVVKYKPNANGSINQWTGDSIQVPAGSFYANYDSDINGTYGDGVLTGTPTGGATVSGSKLDLAHSDVRYVDYAGASNVSAAIQTGCIRFKLTPNYTSSPASEQFFFMISQASGSLVNSITLSHQIDRDLRLRMYDSAGVIKVNYDTPDWVAVSGQEYEFELNWDFNTAAHRIFIDGEQFGSTNTTVGTRSSNVALFRIGSNQLGSTSSNFIIDKLIIFNTPQHVSTEYPMLRYGENITGDNYNFVDDNDVASAIDRSWVETNSTGQKETYDLTKASAATISRIYGVQSHYRTRRFGQSPVTEITPYVYINSTEYDSTPHSPVPFTMVTPLLTPMSQNPDTGVDWTETDIDNMELGVKT